MKFGKKIGWIVLGLVVILSLVGFLFIQSLKPDYKGNVELSGLSEKVEVYFDPYGIPHIYAKDESDAFKALGYVHAQDRLWQMELLRRVARGGLSEVFGKELVATDKLFLSLGIDDATSKSVNDLDKNSQMFLLCQSYLEGINQFIKTGPTPIEFYLTGTKKELFMMKDIYNAIGYMAFSFAMAHKTDPLLSNIYFKLGETYVTDLLRMAEDSTTVLIKNYNPTIINNQKTEIPATVTVALSKLPLPQFIGSNSWVIAPSKTKNGKVILANDPHIGFAQPSVWYEAHIQTPTYEKYGYHLAGIPFPLLGHNRKLAYGLTMFENDDIDFYYEEINPKDSSQYKVAESWSTFEKITKTINIKDEEAISFTYKKSRHGPIVNAVVEQMTDTTPVSMSWIYTQKKNRVMDALYGLSHAQNMEQFQMALPDIHAPGLNVMYGDDQGNVAWWASASLYKMPDSAHTKLILDGTGKAYERGQFLGFNKNPQAINPPWKYVYSANNQPSFPIEGKSYPGYYLPENRAKRIVQLLEAKNDWDSDSVSEMITDITSSVNPEIVTNLAKLVDVTQLGDNQIKLLDALSKWRGDYPLESIEATLFHRWIYFFLKNIFQDELGETMFTQFLATHLHKRVIAPLTTNDNSVWWDDVTTPGTIETKKDIVHKSFVEAMESLQTDLGEDSTTWQWKNLHTLEHEHPIGQIASLRGFFNVGPFPVPGSREVINNMAFPYNETGLYKVNAGPSTRRVIDFSDIENSLSILPTGQSGNPLSPHYKDQATMFVKGEFRKMMMNKEEILRESENLLIFSKREN